MVDIDKIERAAEAATPGPWIQLGGLPYLHATSDPKASPWSTHCIGRFDYSERDMHHIANCDPQTILKLIAVVRAAKAMIDLYDKLALVLPGSESDALKEELSILKLSK